jgi:hypothetical protein
MTGTNQQRFDAMTPQQHAEMKQRLFQLGKDGGPLPTADTLEGYAHQHYLKAVHAGEVPYHLRVK